MQEMPRSTSETFRYFYTLNLYQCEFKRKLALILAFAFTFFVIWQRLAFALPSGYNTEHGDVQFEQANEKTLNISASHNSIINYNSFNIAADETVNFSLPSTDSFSLNRVTGGGKTSIFGNLYANGNLILVNTNGFHFGQTARVNAGGLMVSTHNISNANFLAGRYIFAGLGSGVNISQSYILNEGNIKTREGGMAVFVADAIENRGVIEAPLGMVALAAGNMITVGISYDGLISVGIDEPTAHKITDHNGVALDDQVKNTGVLSANGGKVLVNAQAVHNIFASGINMSGTVQANKVQVGKDGVIEIVSSGDMEVKGLYEAEGGKVNFEAGKEIRVTGDTVTKGDTTFNSKEDIVVNADVTTDSGTLIFRADSDLDGVGAFLQKAGTTIKTTTFGDIKIYSSGESMLANIRSAGKVTLEKAGAPVKYVQHPDSKVSAAASLNIGAGVELKAANTVYEVATDWVNQGAFAPDASSVKLVGPSHSVVYGDNTFNNFEVIEPEKTVSFEAGKTQEIVGVLTLKGTNGKLLVIRSTQPSIPWIIKPTGPTDVAFVDLQDSTNVNIHGPPALAAHSLNSLGNTGWVFSDVVFLGSHSNLWSDPANWDGGFLPGAGSVVKFSFVSPDSLIDGDYAIAGLVLDATYAGTLYASSHTLTVSGDWANHGGHFDAGTSTVVFNDASKASTISGSTTFYNFTSLTPGKHFYFATEGVTTILGTWKLQGADYAEYHIHLNSVVEGAHWYINPKGPRDLWAVIVKDGVNLDPAIIMMTGSNRGNSVNWDPIIYWDGGSVTTVNWSDAANWGPTNVIPGAGDDVWFGGQAGAISESTTVDTPGTLFGGQIGSLTISSTAPAYIGTITVNKNLLISGTTGSLTMTNTSGGLSITTGVSVTVTGDYSQAAGVPVVSGAGTLIFSGTAAQSFSKTVGTLSSLIQVNKTGGSLNLAATTNAITGTFTLTAGTIALSTFNLDLDGATTWAGTVTSGGGSVLASSTFTQTAGSIASINFDGSTATLLLSAGTSLGNVTFTNTGTKTLGNGTANTANMTVTGNLTANGTGSVSGNGAQTITLSGNFSQTNTGIFGNASLSLAFAGDTTHTINQTAVPFAAQIILDNTGETVNLASNFTVNSTGSLQLLGTAGTSSFNGSGFIFSLAGVFSEAAGTFNGGSNTNTFTGTWTLSGGTYTASSGTTSTSSTFSASGSPTFNHNSGTWTFDVSTATLTPNGLITFNNVNFTNTGTKTLGNGTANTGNFTINGNLSYTGTGTALSPSGVQTVTLLGSFSQGASTLLFGGSTNLVLVFSGATAAPTISKLGGTFSAAIQVNKSSGTLSISPAGTFAISSSGSLTVQSGTFQIGASSTLQDDGAYSQSGGVLDAINGTLDFNGSFTLSGGTVSAPSATSFTIAGAFAASGSPTFTHNSGTVTFDASTATLTPAGLITFNSVTFNNTGTKTLGSGVNGTGNFTINGNLSYIGTGTALSPSGVQTVTLLGSYSQGASTLLFGGSTNLVLVFSGGGSPTFTKSGGTFSAAMQVNKSAGTLNLSAGTFLITSSGSFTTAGTNAGTLTLTAATVLDVDGVFTHNAGTITAGSGTIQVSTTFTQTGGTIDAITLDGSSTSMSQTGGSIGNLTFNHTGSKTLTTDLTVTGNLTYTAGSLFSNSVAHNINLSGNFSQGGTTTTFGDTFITLTFTGSAAQSISVTVGTFNAQMNVNKSSGTLTTTAALNIGTSGSLTVTSGTLDISTFSLDVNNTLTTPVFTMTGGSITRAGAGSLLIAGGFNQTLGTISVPINFDTSTATLSQSGGSINADVTFSHTSGTKSFNSDFTITGNLTYSGLGGALQALTSGRTVNITGNYNQSNGTFGQTFSPFLTLGFTGTNAQTFTRSAGTFSGGIQVNKASNTMTLASALTMGAGQTFTITSGTFVPSTFTWTMTGATFSNNGTVRLVGTETTSTIVGLTQDIISGTWEYVGRNIVENLFMLDFGATDHFNLVINDANVNKATYFSLAAKSIAGAFTVTGGSYNANTFSTTVGGLTTVNGGTYNASAGQSTLNGGLTVSSGTFTATAAAGAPGGVVVSGNVTISGSGILQSPAGTMTVSGNFSHTAGTFTHNSGTVILNGTSQTLSGTTTFFNLTKTVTSAATLTFPSGIGNETIITGTLTLQGVSGNLLSLRSSSSPTQWRIDPQGIRSISFVDVQDSNNINITAISANSSVNSGNNLNWSFVNTVTGRVFTDAGVTGMGSGRTVAISINGAAASGTGATDGSGNYSVAFSSTAANDVLTLYIDNATEDAVTVSIAAGNTSLSGIDLYQNYLIVRHENGGPVTNTTLDTADNNADVDISSIYSVSGGAATLVSGKSLFVWSGKTYTPTSGAVTSGLGVDIRGTLNMGVNTLTLPGNFGITGGTFTTSGTVVFNGSGAQTFNPGAGSYVNVTHSGVGTLQLVTNNLTVTGNFTNSAGTFDLNNLNWTMTGATFSNDGTVRLQGNETITGLTQDINSGTWLYQGRNLVETLTLHDFGATDFFNLTINPPSVNTTFQSLAAKAIAGAFTISWGTYSANGNTTTVTGLTTMNSSGATYTTSTSAQTFNGGLTLSSGIFNANSSSVTVTGTTTVSGATYNGSSTTQTFNGNVNVSAGSLLGNSGAIDINGDLTISGSGLFRASLGTTSLSGAYTHTSGGTFQHNSGTFVLDGSTSAVIDLPPFAANVSETFNNFQINATNGTIKYLGYRDLLDVLGTLTLFDGQFERQKSGALFGFALIHAWGNVTVNPNWDGGNVRLNFIGSAVQLFNLSGGAEDKLFRTNIGINKPGGEVFLQSNLLLTSVVSRLNIVQGVLNLNGYNLSVARTDAVGFTNFGTIRLFGAVGQTVTLGGGNYTSAGTWEYKGDGDFAVDTFTVLDFGLTDYFNLIMNTTDGVDIFYFANNTTVAGTMTVSNTGGLTFQAGTTLTVSGSLTLQGISSANRMELRSTSPGSQWFLNAPASYSLSFLDVQDSNALGSVSDPLVCSSCTNTGNNTSWTI